VYSHTKNHPLCARYQSLRPKASFSHRLPPRRRESKKGCSRILMRCVCSREREIKDLAAPPGALWISKQAHHIYTLTYYKFPTRIMYVHGLSIRTHQITLKKESPQWLIDFLAYIFVVQTYHPRARRAECEIKTSCCIPAASVCV